MPAKKEITTAELKEDMQQVWEGHPHGCKDQYGFVIVIGIKYKLYWRNNLQIATYTLQACKEISTILLNDKLLAG